MVPRSRDERRDDRNHLSARFGQSLCYATARSGACPGVGRVTSATLSFSIMRRRDQFGGAIKNVFEELKIQVSTKPVSFGLRSSALIAPTRHIQFRISC